MTPDLNLDVDLSDLARIKRSSQSPKSGQGQIRRMWLKSQGSSLVGTEGQNRRFDSEKVFDVEGC